MVRLLVGLFAMAAYVQIHFVIHAQDEVNWPNGALIK